jgi:D-sedoheptulose 7-phosphate isomerase
MNTALAQATPAGDGLSAESLRDYVQLYLEEQAAVLRAFPVADVVRAVELVFAAYEEGRTVFAMGNGGNAGTVDHLYCDFKHHPFVTESKTEALPYHIKRLHFVNLCSSPAELSGLVNDLGPEMMFAGALAPQVKTGDLVMGYSGSGNSPNIVRALELAQRHGARTLAITRGNGGKCRALADVCIVIPGSSRFPGQTGKNDNNFHFEDAVLSINSMIVGLLQEKVARQLGGARP